jgi:hypothetical protein
LRSASFPRLPALSVSRQVGSKCWSDIDRRYKDEISAEVWFGPGYLCYVVCLFGAFMRATFHWLTPIPGGGSGCTPQLPQSLMQLLDEDSDGVVTWAEVKTEGLGFDNTK